MPLLKLCTGSPVLIGNEMNSMPTLGSSISALTTIGQRVRREPGRGVERIAVVAVGAAGLRSTIFERRRRELGNSSPRSSAMSLLRPTNAPDAVRMPGPLAGGVRIAHQDFGEIHHFVHGGDDDGAGVLDLRSHGGVVADQRAGVRLRGLASTSRCAPETSGRPACRRRGSAGWRRGIRAAAGPARCRSRSRWSRDRRREIR